MIKGEINTLEWSYRKEEYLKRALIKAPSTSGRQKSNEMVWTCGESGF